MKKKWLPTIFIVVVLMGMIGYLLVTMTDIEDKVNRLLVKPPDLEVVDTYFPNDESKYLGSIASSYTEDDQYLFLIKRQGVQELLILPKDFNNQDINKRTYMTLSAGEFIPNEEVNPVRMTMKDYFLNEKGVEVSIRSFHKLTLHKKGIQEESVVDFYKIEYFEKDDEILFYQDAHNVFTYKGDIELLKQF